jgi:hypothetical protein
MDLRKGGLGQSFNGDAGNRARATWSRKASILIKIKGLA